MCASPPHPSPDFLSARPYPQHPLSRDLSGRPSCQWSEREPSSVCWGNNSPQYTRTHAHTGTHQHSHTHAIQAHMRTYTQTHAHTQSFAALLWDGALYHPEAGCAGFPAVPTCTSSPTAPGTPGAPGLGCWGGIGQGWVLRELGATLRARGGQRLKTERLCACQARATCYLAGSWGLEFKSSRGLRSSPPPAPGGRLPGWPAPAPRPAPQFPRSLSPRVALAFLGSIETVLSIENVAVSMVIQVAHG